MRWATAIGAGLLVGMLASLALAGERYAEPDDCKPSFLTMEPDAGAVYTFLVVLPGQVPRTWTFGSRARCVEARATVAEALEALGAGSVTQCR